MPGSWPAILFLVAATISRPSLAGDLRLQGLDLAYNLDHEESVQVLRRAIAAAPNDAAPYRTLGTVLWLRMLFVRGSVTVDHYLGAISRTDVQLPKPAPELVAEFRQSVSKAIELSRKRIKDAPRDAQAHYDLGVALGLEASYDATIDGRLLAGVRSASRCYDEHERVLELDPSRNDAALIVGTYRYLVASLPVTMRLLAYVAGFGGGKQRGIELLERAAAGSGEARTDAMFALVLVYNRERRYDDAIKVLRRLRGMYPRNRILMLEEGSTALRAGRPGDAEALLTQGIGALSRDARAKIPGEEQLWRYKRGAARAALGRDDTIEDLQAATSTGAQAWVAGRARVEIARIALRRGDKASAIAEARKADVLCGEGNDPMCVANARRILRDANGR